MFIGDAKVQALNAWVRRTVVERLLCDAMPPQQALALSDRRLIEALQRNRDFAECAMQRADLQPERRVEEQR